MCEAAGPARVRAKVFDAEQASWGPRAWSQATVVIPRWSIAIAYGAVVTAAAEMPEPSLAVIKLLNPLVRVPHQSQIAGLLDLGRVDHRIAITWLCDLPQKHPSRARAAAVTNLFSR